MTSKLVWLPVKVLPFAPPSFHVPEPVFTIAVELAVAEVKGSRISNVAPASVFTAKPPIAMWMEFAAPFAVFPEYVDVFPAVTLTDNCELL